jgi:23S rRNA (adenine2503-C2)-methyltransferase
MEILSNLVVPTGNILIVSGERGKLECLSIGDYGKEKNIKADFLGLKKEINGVPNGGLIPLTEKWVIIISTQYGCSIGCTFCDVPKVGPGLNATKNDMINQVKVSMSLHPEITQTKRLNIHFARMGEPSFNDEVINAAVEFKNELDDVFKIHPVVSTMMPNRNIYIDSFIYKWLIVKNKIYNGNAGLQLSINSTDEEERRVMFRGNALTLKEIASVMKDPEVVGRKITLNFALAKYTIDPDVLLRYFDPKKYLIKITPMHATKACSDNDLLTYNGYDFYYPYKETEEKLKKVGYDVIVFIPSHEEDESRITCGNAILSEKEWRKGIK